MYSQIQRVMDSYVMWLDLFAVPTRAVHRTLTVFPMQPQDNCAVCARKVFKAMVWFAIQTVTCKRNFSKLLH